MADLHAHVSTEMYFKQPTIYSREAWGAREPARKILMRTPVVYFVFRRVDTDNCYNKEECGKIIRELQDKDMDERRLPDIQYNFLIGTDGSIYEGRGWYTAPEPFPKKKWKVLDQQNTKTLYVGLLGDNGEKMETRKQELSVFNLIGDGCEKNVVCDNAQYMMWEEIAYTRYPFEDDLVDD